MFVDEKKHGEAPTKADPFSLDTLIAWLEKQPASKAYQYDACRGCMLWQYFKDQGLGDVMVSPTRLHIRRDIGWDMEGIPLPEHFNVIAIGRKRTMGAALDRARAQRSPQ